MSRLQINELPKAVQSAVAELQEKGTRFELLNDETVVAEIIPSAAVVQRAAVSSAAPAHDPHGSDASAILAEEQYRTMGESLRNR